VTTVLYILYGKYRFGLISAITLCRLLPGSRRRLPSRGRKEGCCPLATETVTLDISQPRLFLVPNDSQYRPEIPGESAGKVSLRCERSGVMKKVWAIILLVASCYCRAAEAPTASRARMDETGRGPPARATLNLMEDLKPTTEAPAQPRPIPAAGPPAAQGGQGGY
jgi:hypothetical protein